MSDKYCVLCEAEGEEVIARYVTKFNGDKIPVCQKHKEICEDDNILDVLNEQYSQ